MRVASARDNSHLDLNTNLTPFWERVVLALILYSTATYFVEVEWLRGAERRIPPFLVWSERAVAVAFTIEYFARWWRDEDRKRYPFTFMAILDMAAVLPFWLGLVVDLRALRLARTLRLLRLLKLYRYNQAMQGLVDGVRRARYQLGAAAAVILVILFMGAALMHEAEQASQPEKFGRFSDSLWWTLVTCTTVGYGDSFPLTVTGKIVAGIVMVLGIGAMGSFLGVLGGACFQGAQHEVAEEGIAEAVAAERARCLEIARRCKLPDEGLAEIESV